MTNFEEIYEIIVVDKNGDRHRYISDCTPELDDDGYSLVIDHFDGETTYILTNVISWTVKDISDLKSVEDIEASRVGGTK